jgi:hypothetical protein
MHLLIGVDAKRAAFPVVGVARSVIGVAVAVARGRGDGAAPVSGVAGA